MRQLKPTTSYRFKDETNPQTRLAKINGSLIGAMIVLISNLPKTQITSAIYAAESLIEVLDPESPDYKFVITMLNSKLERFDLYI